MSTNKFNYGEDKMSYQIAIDIAVGKLQGIISSNQKSKISFSRERVENALTSNEVIYGINTGFGALCNTVISQNDANVLQENLLKSHAVGVGSNIPKIVSKLMMILKVHSLSMGYSGVSLNLIEDFFSIRNL